MAKTAGTLKWDAWAAPIYLLARLYLIVRSDLDQWRVAKQLSGWPEPCRRAANTPSFYSPSHDCLSVSKLLIKGICRNGKTFAPATGPNVCAAQRSCSSQTPRYYPAHNPPLAAITVTPPTCAPLSLMAPVA